MLMKPRARARPGALPAALAAAVVLVVSACGGRSGILDGDGAGGGGSDGGGAPSLGADGGTGGSGDSADSGRDGSAVDGGCGDDRCPSQPPDASTNPAQPDGVCPMFPPIPPPPTSCWPDGLSCSYDDQDGCAVTAVCTGGTWKLFEPHPTGSECTGTLSGCVQGASCQLPMCVVPDDAGCITTICTCGMAQTYVCYHPVTVPDAGPGCPVRGPCPVPLPPPDGQACADVGFICPYYDGCEVNCLCAAGGWSCARQQGC
jgi:hypothetical protein